MHVLLNMLTILSYYLSCDCVYCPVFCLQHHASSYLQLSFGMRHFGSSPISCGHDFVSVRQRVRERLSWWWPFVFQPLPLCCLWLEAARRVFSKTISSDPIEETLPSTLKEDGGTGESVATAMAYLHLGLLIARGDTISCADGCTSFGANRGHQISALHVSQRHPSSEHSLQLPTSTPISIMRPRPTIFSVVPW